MTRGAEPPTPPEPGTPPPESQPPEQPAPDTPEPAGDRPEPPDQPSPIGLRDALIKSREKIILVVFTVVPLGLAGGASQWLLARFTDQPWQSVWLLLPLTAIAWLLWRGAVQHQKDFQISRRMLTFLAVFILFFSIVAEARFLDFSRPLTGVSGEVVPRNTMGLNWIGDWRYGLIEQGPRARDLVVVTIPPVGPGRPTADLRGDVARLIYLASANRVRGIAFDIVMAEGELADHLICQAAADASLPAGVFIGYTFRRVDGDLFREPLSPILEECLSADSNQGHLVGHQDRDGAVRYIPLSLLGVARHRALSLKVARALGGDDGSEITPPPDLLQFAVHPDSVRVLRMEDLTAERLSTLDDHFLLVGAFTPKDSVTTPFGRVPGLLVHASAIQSLRTGRFLTHSPWWLSLGVVGTACYVLLLLALSPASTLKLVAGGGLLTAGIGALSVATFRLSLIWVDILYPAAAIWLLLVLLVPLRRKLQNAAP